MRNHAESSRRPLEKEENLFSLYSVRPFASVIPMQAKIQVLWASRPQQLKRKILKANKTPPDIFYSCKSGSDWSSGEIETTSEEISLRAAECAIY